MNLRKPLLCFLLVLPLAVAQATPLTEVVPGKAPLTHRVLFLVDVSGSMSGFKFDQACEAVFEISSQPTDELELALMAFDDVTHRWPGLPDPAGPRPIPWGWAALPSQEALDRSSAWLAGQPPQGGTRAIQALRAALAEEREGLSIVFVTDGLFYLETHQEILEAVERAQADRERRDLGRAVILTYGVGGGGTTILSALGETGQGGFYRPKDPPVAPPWTDRPIQTIPDAPAQPAGVQEDAEPLPSEEEPRQRRRIR